MTPEPYYSTREPGIDRQRLLLVSYHFPPRRSAGALRWRKLTPYLYDAGWDLDVITSPPGPPPPRDEGLAELPPGVSLYAALDGPGRLRRFEDGLTAWIRRRRRTDGAGGGSVVIPGGESSETELMIPASRISWTPRSLRDVTRLYHVFLHHEEMLAWAGVARRVGDSLAARNEYRGILASAPPWSCLVAARRLSTTHGIPLILDFRDPWSLPCPLLTESAAHPLGGVLAERYEAAVVRGATAVIMNTPTAERAMAEAYPGTRFRTILNGVDERFHEDVADPREPFRIVYAGSIYIDRDPRVLFAAVGALARELDLRPTDLQLEFIGHATHFSGVPTERLAADAGVEDFFRLTPPVARDELLVRLRKAAVLVSLPQSTPWSMPSKIYEYMGFNARLLAFAERGSATSEVLADTDAVVVDPNDHETTLAVLRRWYHAHRQGGISASERTSARFARDLTGAQLQELLAEVGWVAQRWQSRLSTE